MGEALTHRNHPSPYPLDEHLGNLQEVHPPGGMAEEVVESQAALMGADQVIIAQGVKALQATTQGTRTLVTMALGATMNRLTKTQTKVLGHIGTEVTLRTHNNRLYRASTTGNSSTPPGGELRPRDHNREPPGKDFRIRATTRFANVSTRLSRMRLTTSCDVRQRRPGRMRT